MSTTATTTITEALAELKTIDARLEKQRAATRTYLSRPESQKDPLTKQGGSQQFVASSLQAINDLEERKVAIRGAIARVNQEATITVEGETRTIAAWLAFRRDVAPGRREFYALLSRSIDQARKQAAQQGGSLARPDGDNRPTDVVVNLDEKVLAEQAERLETILGTLDGQLSLKNATLLVTY